MGMADGLAVTAKTSILGLDTDENIHRCLKSPMVELSVGEGTSLVAHEALLMQSPWFVEACGKFPMNRMASTVKCSF
jgi:hypothetical protein